MECFIKGSGIKVWAGGEKATSHRAMPRSSKSRPGPSPDPQGPVLEQTYPKWAEECLRRGLDRSVTPASVTAGYLPGPVLKANVQIWHSPPSL